MLRITYILLLIIGFTFNISAKEGMWIPTLLQKYNIEEMSKMGFKLTAEDIYSVNNASMKDAVVLFGRGCTGAVISNDGLLITNHHCGFEQIQSHSSTTHDYLTNGFWAMNKADELVNPDLTVQFLVKMEDVTGKVLKNTNDKMNDIARLDTIAHNIQRVKKEYLSETAYSADIKPLFNGNQYYIYIYEVFKDIRLVGAPPVSIGKFGGDTDNWVWPRHTGDFSLFRIYAGKDNKPAKYAPDNVPYHPRKFFAINMRGIHEGDFTMVLGYPGTTQRYIPSQAVNMIMTQSDPTKVDIRTVKLDILAAQMKTSPKIRIQYADKYVSASNAWKKWQGEIKGLMRLDAVNTKKTEALDFEKWVAEDQKRKEKYGTILSDFEKRYTEYLPYQKAYDYYSECILRGTDINILVPRMSALEKIADKDKLQAEIKRIKTDMIDYFKDYDHSTDQKVWAALMRIYLTKVDPKFLPDNISREIYKISQENYLEKMYEQSILSDSIRVSQYLDQFGKRSIGKLQKDPVYQFIQSIRQHYFSNVELIYYEITADIAAVQKRYTAALIEMNEGKRMMADANLTLRVAYGKVEGYVPADGVHYNYYTTLKGIIEKDNPDIYDYDVPESLRHLYKNRDFGNYVNMSDEIPVAFCASNHTTGGNSGSPVINGSGELIGLNFDRAWEGTMSDIAFDPDVCRNIALDMRYALFIIDKFAGAGYLLDEMEIVR